MPLTPAESLTTRRLDLRRATIPHLQALIASPEEYHRLFSQRVAEGYIEFPGALEYSLGQAQNPIQGEWWLPYLVIHREEQALIGICGYKGPPDGEQVVEIGYGIAPVYRQQGLATELTAALVAQALMDPEIALVRAHTLPEVNASTRVLAKCGFHHVGSIQDPDDGTIWRWESRRGAEIPVS